MTFSEKIKLTRERAGLTQEELGKAAGITKRAVTAYESQGTIARGTTIVKLASALNVSVKYLSDDACTDPKEDIEKDRYLEKARSTYGSKTTSEAQDIMNAATALFAGGEISQDQKDVYLEAILHAYNACKEEARKRNSKD